MNPSILVEHHPTSDPDRHVVRALLRIEGTAPTDDRRIPLNLSVVLDRSGSMDGDKLRYAKDAARQLLNRVHPTDVTSVVTFESDVDVVAAAAPRASHHDLSGAVDRIRTAGATNLSGGWLEGRSQVERYRSPDHSNRVLLLTDGQANNGITDPDRLAALFAEARRQGVTTSTIGFGRDFDEGLLTRLADAGGGNSHYIEHPDQAPAVFESELRELLTLSAQNLVVEIRLEPGVELAAVHHSYPRQDDAGTLRLRLGDLYAAEPKELLVELGAFAPGEADTALASIDIRGDVLAEDGSMEQRRVSLPLSFSPARGAVVHPEIQRTLVFLQAAAARREALELERRGHWEEGARRLRQTARAVREVADDVEGTEEADDLERMAAHLTDRTFSVTEAKYMHHRAYSSERSKPGMRDVLSRSARERRAGGAPGAVPSDPSARRKHKLELLIERRKQELQQLEDELRRRQT